MQLPVYLTHPMIVAQVVQALEEDLGPGDVSASLVEDTAIQATLICRDGGILAGTPWFNAAFHHLDAAIDIQWAYEEGQNIHPNDALVTLSGSAKAILQAERTALNFLQTLSGTATVTRRYVDKLHGTQTKLLDTRKTIPHLRLAQKYAVLCGGGVNHRLGLYDRVLLKENHLHTTDSIAGIIQKAIASGIPAPIEIEVETLQQLNDAIDAQADWVMLDNFTIDDLRQAVHLNNGRVKLEASGNITLDRINQVAQTGVDYVSVGAITKSISPLDLSLRFDR